MKRIRAYHHFKGLDLGPVAEVERLIIQRIAKTSVPDYQRENSQSWEFKHSSGSIQFARLLAKKRGLDERICAIAMALHDIYAIDTGRYADHARLGEPIAKEILTTIEGLTGEETSTILRMVRQHSRKNEFTNDAYVELAKDVDVLDCLLYPDSALFYLIARPARMCRCYFSRMNALLEELALPHEPAYDCLEGFRPGWLELQEHYSWIKLPQVLNYCFQHPQGTGVDQMAPRAVLADNTGIRIFATAPPRSILSSSDGSAKASCVAHAIEEVASLGQWLLISWPAFGAYELSSRPMAELMHRLDELGASNVNQSFMPLGLMP